MPCRPKQRNWGVWCPSSDLGSLRKLGDRPDMIRPQNYFHVPNAEDRLFISEEHVDLFMHRGLRLQT